MPLNISHCHTDLTEISGFVLTFSTPTFKITQRLSENHERIVDDSVVPPLRSEGTKMLAQPNIKLLQRPVAHHPMPLLLVPHLLAHFFFQRLQ